MSLNTATAENRAKLGRLDNYLPVYSGDVNPMVNQLNNMGSYKSYAAILSQGGTADPTAIVLHNTLPGTIVWERINAGNYIGTLTGAFTENKTLILATAAGGESVVIIAFTSTVSTIGINTLKSDTASSIDFEGDMNIEIRVYN